MSSKSRCRVLVATQECVTPHFFPKSLPHALEYCGTVVAVLWKSCVRLISRSAPQNDTLLFRFFHVPCTVRQPAKSTFTWPLICSPQKYMWSGCSKMTSNWRISSGTCLLQNSCNMRQTAICVTLHLNTGLSKKMDGIWNRYNLKSTGRIYTFAS